MREETDLPMQIGKKGAEMSGTYRCPGDGTVTVAHIVYALHTFSIVIGVLTGATIAGAFLFSWPSILAVVLNYVFRNDARDTFLESHFMWQISTFWYAALYLLIVLVVGLVLMFVGVGIFVYLFGFLIIGIWVAYRIIYGWSRLFSRNPIIR